MKVQGICAIFTHAKIKKGIQGQFWNHLCKMEVEEKICMPIEHINKLENPWHESVHRCPPPLRRSRKLSLVP